MHRKRIPVAEYAPLAAQFNPTDFDADAWVRLAAEAGQKYVVCNADEGDSGTFADRMLMEGDPFVLLEGMTIAGWAVGAHEGFIYVRSEYPDAVEALTAAIAADAGMVMTQAVMMFPATPQRTADVRRAAPTPMMAPVMLPTAISSPSGQMTKPAAANQLRALLLADLDELRILYLAVIVGIVQEEHHRGARR